MSINPYESPAEVGEDEPGLNWPGCVRWAVVITGYAITAAWILFVAALACIAFFIWLQS